MLDYTSLYCNTTDSDRCFSLPASVSAETGRKAAQMWCKSVSSQNPGVQSSWARCSRRLWALWHLCCVFTAVLSLPWGILKCKKNSIRNISFTTKINTTSSQVLLDCESCKLLTGFANPDPTSSLCIPFLSLFLPLQSVILQTILTAGVSRLYRTLPNIYKRERISQALQRFPGWLILERGIKKPHGILGLFCFQQKEKGSTKGPPTAENIPTCKLLGNSCVPVCETEHILFITTRRCWTCSSKEREIGTGRAVCWLSSG